MLSVSAETLDKAHLSLDKNCPSPEGDFSMLGKSIASRPPDKFTGEITHAAEDIQNLIDEIRWHIGQALLLWEVHPELNKIGQNDGSVFDRIGFPGFAPLLLRKYTLDATKVLYSDLSTKRKGSPVSGWIFHMMIDDSVYRAIAALDRLARILWILTGKLPKRIYFSSQQLKKINSDLNEPETEELLAIAQRDVLGFLHAYRDGLAHDRKFSSRLAGSPFVHVVGFENGQPIYERPTDIGIEDLFALAHVGYHQVTDALTPLTKLCVKKWPIGREYQ